jgi:23S rRNA pseudouridine1911/1915/1917 synthase
VLGPSTPKGRVDKVLVEQLPGVSRATIQRWIGEGRVLVAGRPCRARDAVGPGDVLEVHPGAPPPSRAEPDASVELRVLYEDPHLIVVDKQAGLVVHPGRGHFTGTLVNGLLARPGFARPTADPRDPEGAMRPGIVHRIDKDTSGVLVVARTELAREGLKDQLSRHSVERVYRAITLGVPPRTKIETLHGRDPASRLRFSSRVLQGRRAVTHVRPLEVLAGGRAALVECQLETGRTHQIRVHLSEQTKTPILADELYGGRRCGPELLTLTERLGRQALHAAVLGFVHPATGEALRFETPLPEDMQTVLDQLRELDLGR